MITREFSSWIEKTSATAATATATRAAPAGGLSHFVTSLSGGFSAAEIGKTLTLESPTGTEIGRWRIHNSLHLPFPSPIKGVAGAAVVVKLEAGAAGVVGSVSMTGYTA